MALVLAVGALARQTPNALVNTERYEKYRQSVTVPLYELAKVESLIKKTAKEPAPFDFTPLPKPEFDALDVKAKFTYCMIHPEGWSQGCFVMPTIEGEDHMIFGRTVTAFWPEADWSDRQRSFLHSHRSEVVRLLQATIRESDRVGANLKKAIVELDVYEAIPEMTAVYAKTPKDQDILSVFCILMKDGKFKPFTRSEFCLTLYGPSSSYQSHIPANSANEKRILDQAMAYYKTRKS